MLNDFTNPLAEWIFPRRCFVCNRDINSEHICVSCLSFCNPIQGVNLLIDNFKPALFFYEMAIRELIIRIKFYCDIGCACALMKLVEKQLVDSKIIEEIKAFNPSVITYVPTHWFNRLQRKIDLPQLFALTLSKCVNIPWGHCLKRNVWFYRQMKSRTKRERKQGIIGSFSLAKLVSPYERILLVDDIVTTGATFDESKKMLKQVSKQIKYLAIARTP